MPRQFFDLKRRDKRLKPIARDFDVENFYYLLEATSYIEIDYLADEKDIYIFISSIRKAINLESTLFINRAPKLYPVPHGRLLKKQWGVTWVPWQAGT
ncbi:hypothetical protein TEQG_08778 [Trichophyton equinum CBS 127.97]|uniref:Uncharacterized protein n=1 Tax=Trichophyton equinum (strain ATCC MYA-4606 / CBS 127.97) TaxID=559882 RepID=F2Q266_TRIEC|nr:hypothetical protein TEQG_08778 [Trichophyton equinum CBS 127.97]